MSIVRLKAIHKDFDGRTIEVEFDDTTGEHTDEQCEQWTALMDISGEAGNWVASWKADVKDMMDSRYEILGIV